MCAISLYMCTVGDLAHGGPVREGVGAAVSCGRLKSYRVNAGTAVNIVVFEIVLLPTTFVI